MLSQVPRSELRARIRSLRHWHRRRRNEDRVRGTRDKLVLSLSLFLSRRRGTHVFAHCHAVYHRHHCARHDNGLLTRGSSIVSATRRTTRVAFSLSWTLTAASGTSARVSRQSPRAARSRRGSPLRSLHPRSSTGVPTHACFPGDDRPSGTFTFEKVRADTRVRNTRAHGVQASTRERDCAATSE